MNNHADNHADIWGPTSVSYEKGLEATRRHRNRVADELDVALAALAAERESHAETRRHLAEREEAFARDREAWETERTQLIADAQREARDAADEAAEQARRDRDT